MLIYQAGSSIESNKSSISAKNVTVVPEFIYKIKSATTKITTPIEATEDVEDLASSINVKEGADIIIDLKGHTLKSTTSVLNLAKGATVKIQNTLDPTKNEVEGTNGIIESTSTTEAAIDIKDGSQVEVLAGTIKNESGTAVAVDGANSKFTLNGGIITSVSGKDAVNATETANVQLTSGTISAGNVTLNGATSTEANNIKISLPGALTAKAGAKVVVEGEDVVLKASVISNASDVTINVKALTSLNIGGANSQLTLNGGEASGRVILAGTGSRFTMTDGSFKFNTANYSTITAGAGTTVDIQGGKVAATGAKSALSLTSATATISGAAQITASGAEAIVDAEGTAKSTLTINGGAIETTKASAAAIKIANGTDVIITDGSITGTESAVDITSGTLKVNGSGEPTLKGNTYVINAVPTENATVKVYLDNAKAYYTGSKDKYSIYNHNDTSSAVAAIESISGGHFIGDIISDNSKHFVSGGYFQSCSTLESTIDYFVTTKKPGKAVDAENYWTVVERTLD
jgi:ribosomal protein L24